MENVKRLYEIKEANGTKYFVKNNKVFFLDEFEIWGLDKSIWYDKIDYFTYKVKFKNIDGKEYISLRKIK